MSKQLRTGGFYFVALGLVLAAGCSTIRSHSDYDPEAKFDTYSSFKWADEDQSVQSRVSAEQTVNPLNVQRIRQAIVSELKAKGYSHRVDQDAVDFTVSFTVGVREQTNLNAYPLMYEERWVRHWPYYGSYVDVHTYTEGTLAIDVYDGGTLSPVWHGVARKQITRSDVEESAPLIRSAVSAILKDFPPN